MKKATISIFMILVFFSSCDIGDKLNKSDETTKNGTSTEVNIQITSDVKANKAYFYEYEVNFPKLTIKPENTSTEISKNFNEEVEKFINSYLKGYAKDGLIEKKEIVDIILKEDSLEAKDNHMVYSLNISYLTNETTDGVLSIKFIVDHFSLGAHGNTYFKTFNYDLKTGKFLTIEDLLNVGTDGNIAKLDKLIAENYNNPLSCFDVTPKSTLKDMQFSITEENAVFSYEPYILGTYTCGSCTILVPISKLKEAKLWKHN